MQCPNLFKRIIPFALALILGLLAASFFVNLAPSFRVKRQRMFHQWKAEYQELQLKCDRLKDENERLQKENEGLKAADPEWRDEGYKNLYKEWEVPPPPPPPGMEKRLKEKPGRLEKLK